MADIHPSPGGAPQNPQATNSGSAPVPYQGPRPSEPPAYGVTLDLADAAGEVMNGIGANPSVHESASAHDIAAGLADAPYAPGSIDPIFAGGDADAGGRDDVGGSVQAAVDAATARWQEHMADNGHTGMPGAGASPVHAGIIGDLMHFPPSPLDPGAGVGNTSPVGAFYDPDREYGGEQGAPGYQGEAQ